MKKLDDAVRRFGTPDHGRTAKRLRDFEAQLVQAGAIEPQLARDMQNVSSGEPIAITGSYGRPSDLFKQGFGSEAHDKVIARQYGVIQNLQVLLNQKDEEIDMLRSAPPVRARDLWFVAAALDFVCLAAYYGAM